MEVHKVGGSSLGEPSTFLSTMEILKSHVKTPAFVVASAMGKTTNAIESLLQISREGGDIGEDLKSLREFHTDFGQKLGLKNHQIQTLSDLIDRLEVDLYKVDLALNPHYDLVIRYGELLSTQMIFSYLGESLKIVQLPADEILITDSVYRKASVDWDSSTRLVTEKAKPLLDVNEIVLTQGFIGRDSQGRHTSLGREGSDYTGAVLASILNADGYTVWKDVKGIYSADPHRYPWAQPIVEMDYTEMLEMGYYGAKVIHPRTIKPLENLAIPLYVKCFKDPSEQGTVIADKKNISYPPLVVESSDQVLCTIRTRDLSYVTERHLEYIFGRLHAHHLKMNIMRNSALSFQICFEYQEERVESFIADILQNFDLEVKKDLVLLTVRHSNKSTMNMVQPKGKVLLNEVFDKTHQILYKP